ncbi:MAG: hypothetical protein R6V83_10530 [Candidatus Thorarchaeota archaeon]
MNENIWVIIEAVTNLFNEELLAKDLERLEWDYVRNAVKEPGRCFRSEKGLPERGNGVL